LYTNQQNFGYNQNYTSANVAGNNNNYNNNNYSDLASKMKRCSPKSNDEGIAYDKFNDKNDFYYQQNKNWNYKKQNKGFSEKY